MISKRSIWLICLLHITHTHTFWFFGYNVDVNRILSSVSSHFRTSEPQAQISEQSARRAAVILSHIAPEQNVSQHIVPTAAGRQSAEVVHVLKLAAAEKFQPIADYFNFKEVKNKYPTLKAILEQSAVKNPTLGRVARDKIDRCCLLQDHMERIVESFNRQYPHFKQELNAAEDLKQLLAQKDFLTFFKAFLLLHDIGKPLGPLEHQHANTVPIMRAYLNKWQFTPRQVDLAVTLVDDDIVGDIAIAGLSANNAQKIIAKNAAQLGLTQRTLYNLHHLFWSIDAGSYKTLEQCIVQRPDGRSVPSEKQKAIKQLEAAIK